MITQLLIQTMLCSQILGQDYQLVRETKIEEGYRTYRETQANTASFFVDEEVNYQNYYLIPEVSELKVWVNNDQSYARLQIGNFYSINGDLNKLPNREGKRMKNVRSLSAQMKLRSTESFRSIINELNANEVSGKIQIDDRRGTTLKQYEIKLHKVDFESFDSTLTTLYQAAAKASWPLHVAIVTDRVGTFTEAKLVSHDLIEFELESGAGIRAKQTAEVHLPLRVDWDRWSRADNREVKFHAAYESLDTLLIPYIENNLMPAALTSVPEDLWKKQVLDQAINLYYEDAFLNTRKACGGYTLRPRANVMTGKALVEYFEFVPETLKIQMRVQNLLAY